MSETRNDVNIYLDQGLCIAPVLRLSGQVPQGQACSLGTSTAGKLEDRVDHSDRLLILSGRCFGKV